jgi:hypothetical protein
MTNQAYRLLIILGSGYGGAASISFDTSVIIYSTQVSIDLALSRL